MADRQSLLRLLLTDFDLDGLGFYLFRLWNLQIQHAVLERGLDIVFVNIRGQRKTAAEAAERGSASFPFLIRYSSRTIAASNHLKALVVLDRLPNQVYYESTRRLQ